MRLRHQVQCALAATAALVACGDADTSGVVDTTADVRVDTAADVAMMDAGPVVLVRCDTHADCVDGKACTTDLCVGDAPDAICVWEIIDDWCFINNICFRDGEPRANRPCQRCDRALSDRVWSQLPETEACDDGNACTGGDACRAGRCEGMQLPCDDGQPCTVERCDPQQGCVSEPISGVTCDDTAVCTEDDVCIDGTCMGSAVACDDGDPCTVDACDPVAGCVFAMDTAGAACDDGDACTTGDACEAGACVAGPPTDCDDDNPCTIDLCDVDIGCVTLPTQTPCCQGVDAICDDEDPCTTDLCDPETTECSYLPSVGPCDDGDGCTTNDMCSGGVCFGVPAVCDDDNPCTDDSCSANTGCVFTPTTGASCDDALACSSNDVCVAGVCEGDATGCLCDIPLPPDGAKLTSLQIGASGTPGNGVDVDLDPQTCAPSGCSGGIDNTLGILAGLGNASLVDAVSTGEVLLLVGITSGVGDAVEVLLLEGELDPSNGGCDFQTTTCDYLVKDSLLDPDTCEPLVLLPGTLIGDQLVAGGPGTSLPFEIPFSDDTVLEVRIANIRMEATVTRDNTGQIIALDGVLGGAVPKQLLLDALADLPEEDLPADKDAVIGLVDAVVQNDIDTTNDGTKDAASIGLKFTAIDARFTGITD